MNHVHHDLIVAWAKGAKIQWLNSHSLWEDCSEILSPIWNNKMVYRIKTEPKPDVVLYAMVTLDKDFNGVARIQAVHANTKRIETDTCKFTFDGETGKLKSATVL